ncbi:hypothetical protein Taitung201_04960 [Helicobacter pylori]
MPKVKVAFHQINPKEKSIVSYFQIRFILSKNNKRMKTHLIFILKGEKMGENYSQRSNTKNPNNLAYRKAMDNRANQLNPNNSRYKGK